eukprot:837554-Pyramimonas_sp.AAC.1
MFRPGSPCRGKRPDLAPGGGRGALQRGRRQSAPSGRAALVRGGAWGACLLYTSDAADDTPCVDL